MVWMSNGTFDEERNGWHPDPFGRFEERYIVYGEPSRLVRSGGVEQTDRQPLTSGTPAVPAGGLHDRSTPAPADSPTDPAPAASSRAHVRRSRQQAVGVIMILVLCALVATVLASRRNAPATPKSPSGPRRSTRATATIPPPDHPAPRSPQLPALPSEAAPRSGQAPRTAPTTSEHSRTPVIEWANQLLSDLNNINEVAVDYGHGTLEQTACQRTRNDAAKLPAATLPANLTAAARTASRDIVTLTSDCAPTPACVRGGASCGQTKFAKGYRRSVHDLNALQADLRS